MTQTHDSNIITRNYFDSLLLEMRHFDAVIPDTSFTLFGEKFKTPIMMAALSHLNKCHPAGLEEMARGALAAGAVMWSGMGEDEEIERICKTGAKTIKIIKPHFDNAEILREIAWAEKVGCFAVGVDIDHAFNGSGQYDNIFGTVPLSGKTTEELASFVKASNVPFIIKGVLSTKDAKKCLDIGVAGIVVSHHHGLMDYAVPPLAVLHDICRLIKGKIPIFVDCGIESGMDAYKAMALGATAVSVGRAMMGPLTDGGATAVTQKINEMTAQLAGTMARTAVPNVNSMDRTVIHYSHKITRSGKPPTSMWNHDKGSQPK
ncbi:MAG: alpha-hydroxy-acid oxidizing protein [Firmicutes bacterium]|nr:alpha-hydroxy-acid oxidizing protein [Bacillota bacterium]